MDTTVVPADIYHPTDAGLLSDLVKKRILAITKVLKRRSQEAYVKQATEIVIRAREYSATATGATAEKVRRLAQHLEEALNKTARIIEQTRQVQEGNRHLPDRVVSLFDDQARPIKTGTRRQPARRKSPC